LLPGDMYVIINAKLPDTISDELLSLIDKEKS